MSIATLVIAEWKRHLTLLTENLEMCLDASREGL